MHLTIPQVVNLQKTSWLEFNLEAFKRLSSSPAGVSGDAIYIFQRKVKLYYSYPLWLPDRNIFLLATDTKLRVRSLGSGIQGAHMFSLIDWGFTSKKQLWL